MELIGVLSNMGYLIRKSTPVINRKYPDGEPIPNSLPGKYRPSERCDNCAAYVASTKFCRTWDATVRPEYVCAVWKPIKA
jgi:hypothetical protein